MKTETENLRELDAWIAEHVMGWRKVTSLRDYCSDSFITNADADCLAWNWSDRTWKPTTDSAAAMQVLEKCAESGVLNGEFKVPVVIRRRGDKQFVVSESSEDEPEDSQRHYIVVEAETLPLAICKFAKTLYSK